MGDEFDHPPWGAAPEGTGGGPFNPALENQVYSGAYLSTAGISALTQATITRRARFEVKKVAGINTLNASMESGSLGAQPYRWIQGGVINGAPFPISRTVKGVASGGLMGTRQVELSITSGASLRNWVTADTNLLRGFWASGDRIEWDLRYRIPRAAASGSQNTFSLKILPKPGGIFEAFATTQATSGGDWATARGSYTAAVTSGTGVFGGASYLSIDISGTTLTEPSIGNYSDPNFVVFVDSYQSYRVIPVAPEDILAYTYKKSSQFGAAVGEVSLRNQAGKYSPDAGNLISYGDELRIIEEVRLPDATWEGVEVFRGNIREIRPVNEAGINRVSITAFDPLSRLPELDLQNLFTGVRQDVKRDFLLPRTLGSQSNVYSGSNRASVWDASQGNWATSPSAVISLYPSYRALSSRRDTLPDGFQTYPIPGQILFGNPQSAINLVAEAAYTFYVDALDVETVIEDIFCSGDGFGNAPFDRHWEFLTTFREVRSGVDILTCNTAADSLPTTFKVESAGVADGDYARLWVNGVNLGLNSGAAFNIANVTSGGKLLFSGCFNTGIAAHITSMSGAIMAFRSGTYVLAATRGSCYSPFLTSGSGVDALNWLGARFPQRIASGAAYGENLYQSGGYCFIGQVGKSPLSGVIPEVLGRPGEGSLATSQTVFADYPIASIWATRYGNWITSLGASDLTLPAGSSVVKTYPREGVFVLSGPNIDVSSYIPCPTNYAFKTLQATGIQINEFEATLKNQSRFDLLRDLLKVVAPNYIIHAERGKIWGEYFNQKTYADASLATVLGYEQTGDEDVYTRVVVFGKSNNPTNLSMRPETTYLTAPVSLSGSVVDLELVLSPESLQVLQQGGNPAYRAYVSPLSGSGKILNTPYPVVVVNGSVVAVGQQQVLGGGVTVKTIQKTKG